MALNENGKNRLRLVIRITMWVVAVFLLLIALVIPIANNAVALGIENELKAQSMPAQTQMIESISVSGRYTDKDMQYFGAILIKSDLTIEEVSAHFPEYTVEYQLDSAIRAVGKTGDGEDNLSFTSAVENGKYYVVYRWGKAPAWLKGILNMDIR